VDARGILRVLVPRVAALTRCEGVEKTAMRELDNQWVAASPFLSRCGTMLKAKAPSVGPVRHGRLTEFLRRDLFSVKLDNGVTITAVMPEELFPIYDPNVSLSFGPAWIFVEVDMREPPALPRIITACNSPLIG
jgi:hypothetical protein